MNNNERLLAISNSLVSIGKDIKGLVTSIFSKSCADPVEQTAHVAAPATPSVELAPETAIQPAETVPVQGEPKAASPNLKVCSRCKIKKPLDLDHFHRDSHKISGFRSACRECSNGAVKQMSCNGCGVSKPLTSQFWQRNSKAKSGFRAPCKECMKKPKSI